MRLALQITGAEELARDLAAVGRAVTQPLRPLLEVLAAMLQTSFQGHIRAAEGPGGAWPELHWLTQKIRTFYGHPAAGPRLVRAGDLLHSITTLGLGDDFVEVGTNAPAAPILQSGGTFTDPKGRTREVQAFPFVWLSPIEVDDLVETIANYFLPEAAT